jgi:hypothetical protein
MEPMSKQPDDELDEFETLQMARNLVKLAETMMKLSPEEFEKELEELCAELEYVDDDPDREALKEFLRYGAPWGRTVLRKYKQ